MSADTDIDASTDLYGKTISDLQSDIVISDEGAITGTLNYLTDYTGFSEDTDLQAGNFLALHISTPVPATITVQLTGDEEAIVLDDDGIAVLRIADKDTQTLTVVAANEVSTVTQAYDLSGLTCESAGGGG